MKYLFAMVFVALLLAGMVTVSLLPERQCEVPVIYWVSDANPSRIQQIEGFHRWLKLDPNRPACELRLDSANDNLSKKIIQTASGVAGDIMDFRGRDIRFFQTMGVLRDLTDDAQRMGFDIGRTYDAIAPEITTDGRQYAFPCNVSSILYWVNKATFARYGCAVPETLLTLEDFETMGKAFVDRANPDGSHRTVFLCDTVDDEVLMRSMGLSVFNETLTRCTLDDERYVRVLKLIYKWMFEDHLIPTAAERSSFSAESSYGGLTLQMFNQGHYAMVYSGRYAMIQLREFEGLDLAVCLPPHGGYPNTHISTRAATVYAASANPEVALQFLQYLASEDYNMQIVRDADALPPDPCYTACEAFVRPLPLLPDVTMFFPYDDEQRRQAVSTFTQAFYAVTDDVDRDALLEAQRRGELTAFVRNLPVPPRPRGMEAGAYQQAVRRFGQHYAALIPMYQREWSCHSRFAEAANTVAIVGVDSPFVQAATVARERASAAGAYYANRCTAQEAARTAADAINTEIERTLQDTPRLRQRYAQQCAVQKKIDQLRQAGEPIPLEWISNTFYRRYYVDRGLAE